MQNFINVFKNVKRIVDALSTIESLLARLLYLAGVLAQNVVIEPSSPSNMDNISVEDVTDKK